MPVIHTHHKPLLETAKASESSRESGDMNVLISEITFDILKECPALVADVANGEVDRAVLETVVIRMMDKRRNRFGLVREELLGKVFDFMFGYGELQKYIEDDDITDIDGTRYNEFVIKRKGIRSRTAINFGNEKIFDTYCKLVAIRNRGILNENDSHCRVTDETYRLRINVSIKPRNISGPAISIRKHRKKSYTLGDLVGLGMLDEDMAEYIKKLAGTNASVLFCGKGAAGKTTLLRAFVNILPEMERVLVAESDVEIYPDKPYCIEQRIKKENEGGRQVTLRELVRDGLTMSLDCYCIGEIVGDEAWEFIKAAYTGHRAIATTHAESAEDALARLMTLSHGAGVAENGAIVREMLAKGIDVIIYLAGFKVVEILEVKGYDGVSNNFTYGRVFIREHDGNRMNRAEGRDSI